MRLPEWFQAFRPTPTCPRGGQTPQGPDPDLLRPLQTLKTVTRGAAPRAKVSAQILLLVTKTPQISKPRKRRSGGACAPPSQGTNGPLHRQPTSMRSRHKTSPCTALAAILSCATTTRAQNTGHARCARRQRGCRLAKSPATPLRTPGCQVGDPTLHPLTLRLAAKEPADERRGPLPWIRGP